MTSWHENTICIAGPLCGESIGNQWIPPHPSKSQWCGAFAVSLLLEGHGCWTNSQDKWFEMSWCSCDVIVMTILTCTTEVWLVSCGHSCTSIMDLYVSFVLDGSSLDLTTFNTSKIFVTKKILMNISLCTCVYISNKCPGISNHWQLDCLFNSLFSCQ